MEEIFGDDAYVVEKEALLYVIQRMKDDGKRIQSILNGLPDKNEKKLKLAAMDGTKKRRYAEWGIQEVSSPLEFILIKNAERVIYFYNEFINKKKMQEKHGGSNE